MNLELRYIFASYLQKDLSHLDLEKFIYQHSVDLEEILGENLFLELIELNYQTNIYYQLLKSLEKRLAPHIFFDQAIYVVVKFNLHQRNLTSTLNALDDLNDYFELPLSFSGFSSEVNRLGEEYYNERAMEQINKLLDIIDSDRTIYSCFSTNLEFPKALLI